MEIAISLLLLAVALVVGPPIAKLDAKVLTTRMRLPAIMAPALDTVAAGAHRARDALGSEGGEVNIQGLMIMGIAMVFIAVGFIMFPIVMDSTDAILAYSYSANATINAAYFTGLTSVAGIVPLLVLLGFLVAAVITGFMGYRVTKGASNAALSPSNLIMVSLGIVFIAIGLIIYPVSLDGIASVISGRSFASYSGLLQILKVSPLLILIGFTTAGVITGFFGIKSGTKG